MQVDPTSLALLGVGALVVAGSWAAADALLLRWSGWAELAARYGVDGLPPYEHVVRIGFAGVGSASYRNLLEVGDAPRGLGLRVWPPIFVRHRPLLVPWGDIAEATLVQVHLHHEVHLVLRQPGPQVRLPGRTAAWPRMRALIERG